MNPSRYRQLEAGQTSIARKVLAAVPIREAWSTAAIHSEVVRNGSRIDKHILEGCLSALLDSGLIKEPSHHQYQRVGVTLEKPPVPTPCKPTLVKTNDTPPDPLTRFASIATKLRQLADEIDELGLDIEAAKTDNEQELAKLRQLKDLLKGL